MTKRPKITMFMLMSVDGKISTGYTDDRDVDKDIPNISGVAEGLYQYYDIEKTTDLWSFNSGRTMAKIGINDMDKPEKTPVSFVVMDNHNLNEKGVRNMCAKSNKFVLITSNKNHPAYNMDNENLYVIYKKPQSPIADILKSLYENFGCENITLQTGGTINSIFLKEKLLDYVDIIIAPMLVGGSLTPTLIDGSPSEFGEDLSNIQTLELESYSILKNSYIRLRYKTNIP